MRWCALLQLMLSCNINIFPVIAKMAAMITGSYLTKYVRSTIVIMRSDLKLLLSNDRAWVKVLFTFDLIKMYLGNILFTLELMKIMREFELNLLKF